MVSLAAVWLAFQGVHALRLALVVSLSLARPACAAALTTSQGQDWSSGPDAWARGNSLDTSFFGWDVLDGNGPTLSFGRVLDDATPDLGVGVTATGTRLFQGVGGAANWTPTLYGHRSGSGNYYSGFGDRDFVDDAIQATAPSGGSDGFTTVLLQVIAGAPGGNGPQALSGLEFAMEGGAWTHSRSLYGRLASGTGVYWQEWYAPGANLPFSIRMSSTVSSRSIDAFAVDTHWSPDAPTLNHRMALGVPEPGMATLCSLGLAIAAASSRQRRRTPAIRTRSSVDNR